MKKKSLQSHLFLFYGHPVHTRCGPVSIHNVAHLPPPLISLTNKGPVINYGWWWWWGGRGRGAAK